MRSEKRCSEPAPQDDSGVGAGFKPARSRIAPFAGGFETRPYYYRRTDLVLLAWNHRGSEADVSARFA